MFKSQVHAGLCISKERKQKRRGFGGLGSIYVVLYTPLLHPHPSYHPLSLPLTLSCLTYWSAGNNLGEAFRVNGVKVSAARLGDAEKSSVKVTALHCCIAGRLAVISRGHTRDFKPSYHHDSTI